MKPVQPTLFAWLPSDQPPMSAQHDQLRALSPDAPDEDWWTVEERDGLTYCNRHCVHFKAPRCWLCDASRAATVPAMGHRNDMEA